MALAGVTNGGGKGRSFLAEAECVVGHVKDPAISVNKANVSEFCEDVGRAKLLFFVSIGFDLWCGPDWELSDGINRFETRYPSVS